MNTKPKILQVHSFYENYLNSLYNTKKNLEFFSFKNQMSAIIDDAFSASHIIAPYMEDHGYSSMFVVANCRHSQFQWLRDNQATLSNSSDWIHAIVIKQIEEFQPDILYLSHPIGFDAHFIRKLTHKPKLILGWRAASFPYQIDWTGFDVMLSSLRPLLQLATQRGVRAGELFLPGFPTHIAEKLNNIRPTCDIVFSGQYTEQQHAKRGYYLREIARYAARQKYSCAFHLKAGTIIPDVIQPYARPAVFGLKMHQTLRNGRISIDARANHFITAPDKSQIDIGGNDTANMRIFETTGSGAFLLTEHFPNISEYFKIGKEIETFSCRKELLEKIDHYLAHPQERQEIASRGQARCLKDHSMEQRATWMHEIIQRHLKCKHGSASFTVQEKKTVSAKHSSSPTEPAELNSGQAIAPVFEGSFTESLKVLKSMVAEYPRRLPGHAIIDGVLLSFADLHSFYFELEQIFSNHLYGFQTQEAHPLIIDCGAHVGLASLYFALRYPKSIIHAFEADSDIHNLFRSNTQNANLNNVTSYDKAVWIHDDGVRFRFSGDDSGHINPTEGTQIPSIRLKRFLEQFERIDMLKLDVEGAEYEILKDCCPTLNRVQNMIIEVHHLSNEKQRLADIFSILEQTGFQYVVSDLHPATWMNPGNTPPFDYVSHDKFIMTVFAWQPDSHQNKLNSSMSNNSRHPRIAQFCMQDYGGAGTAALRLHDGLISSGIASTFYAHNIQRGKQGTTTLFMRSSALIPGIKKIPTDWDKFQIHNQKILSRYHHRPIGFEVFSDTWTATKLPNVPGVAEADIIHLHWIAGTVDLPREVNFLKHKKIVWTLHDMNAFTGGCHYSAACQKYEQQCGNCPQLASSQENDLSRQIWNRKMMTYRQLDMTIVTPSQWLANSAQKSSLLSTFPIHVIPNGLPTDMFKPYPQNKIRESLRIPKNAFVILFGADSVTNVRKGFIHLIRALEHLKSRVPNDQIVLATFGQNAQSAVKQLGFPTFTFDYVEKEAELAIIYSMADVTVIPSLEDNLPNVVLESLACGTPVVGFNAGGIPDMIAHKSNGYLAPVGDHKELATGIHWIMEQRKVGGNLRLKSRETALRMYNSPLQAKSYQKLYYQILNKTRQNNQ